MSVVSNNATLVTRGVVGRIFGSSSFVWVGSSTVVTFGCSVACCAVGTASSITASSGVAASSSGRTLSKVITRLVVALSVVALSVVMSLERLVVVITATSLNGVDLFFLDGFSVAYHLFLSFAILH